MTELPNDPHTRRVIAPFFGGPVNTMLAKVRDWTAQRRAARVARDAARVARELDALSDAQLKRLGLARRGERS
jgi:galactokinase